MIINDILGKASKWFPCRLSIFSWLGFPTQFNSNCLSYTVIDVLRMIKIISHFKWGDKFFHAGLRSDCFDIPSFEGY